MELDVSLKNVTPRVSATADRTLVLEVGAVRLDMAGQVFFPAEVSAAAGDAAFEALARSKGDWWLGRNC